MANNKKYSGAHASGNMSFPWIAVALAAVAVIAVVLIVVLPGNRVIEPEHPEEPKTEQSDNGDIPSDNPEQKGEHQSEEKPESKPETPQEPVYVPTRLTCGMSASMEELKPSFTGDYAQDSVLATIFEPLLVASGNTYAGRFVEQFGKTGGRGWYVTLKQDAADVEGNQLTADTCAALLLKDERVTECRAADRTVYFTVSSDDASMPFDILTGVLLYNGDVSSPVPTGSYRIKQFDPGKELLLERVQNCEENARWEELCVLFSLEPEKQEEMLAEEKLQIAFELPNESEAGHSLPLPDPAAVCLLVPENSPAFYERPVLKEAVLLSVDCDAIAAFFGCDRVTGLASTDFSSSASLQAAYDPAVLTEYLQKYSSPKLTLVSAREALPIGEKLAEQLKNFGIDVDVIVSDHVAADADALGCDLAVVVSRSTMNASDAVASMLSPDASANWLRHSSQDYLDVLSLLSSSFGCNDTNLQLVYDYLLRNHSAIGICSLPDVPAAFSALNVERYPCFLRLESAEAAD